MTGCAELESQLTRANTAWRDACEALERAKAVREKANAAWAKVLNDRRTLGTDRRRMRTATSTPFSERREADSDRRIPVADCLALSRAVAAQHEAYTAKAGAEASWAVAEDSLKWAAAERDRALGALGAQEGERGKSQAPAAPPMRRTVVRSLRKALFG